jgi:hypothetical protein
MDANLRTHPIIMIAGVAVILTCLLAIGVMIGIVPSPADEARGAEPRPCRWHPATPPQTESSTGIATHHPADSGYLRRDWPSAPPTKSRSASAGSSAARAPVSSTETLPATGTTESPAPTNTSVQPLLHLRLRPAETAVRSSAVRAVQASRVKPA